MEDRSALNKGVLAPELYFLISKFLASGPLKETAKVLAQELEHLNILPSRLDWTGQEHRQTLSELEKQYPHIGPQHLLDICERVGPLLDRELPPSVSGVLSLLGAGRQSLLRTKESVSRPRQLVDYCTRLHHNPLGDVVNRNNNHNLVQVLYGRESAGPITRRLAVPTSFYSKQNLQRRTLGHLSAVYCVLFDRTGKYIVTGADDLLVKLWSAIDGRLLATFRGASAEITDIAINLDNTMLAAGSLDRILRVWDLQYGGPIAVLSGHTGMITSVNFCPSPKTDLRYLVTTSTDGSVAFWEYVTRSGKTTFNAKPISYHEKLRPGQAQMICASFSPGGIFLAAGSADHHVRVYLMSEDGPKRILETESHSDTVDSIQWAHSGLRFISGSKDGTALVWHFESQQWKSIRLNMNEKLPTCPATNPEDNIKLKVTMVSWDNTDNWVITAVNDHTIKVWNAHTGKLHKVLRGHTNEIYVLESHQKDSGVLLSAGHDGQLFIWDLVEGTSIANFLNHIEGQGDGGIYDAKWSPDGMMIAATDSHGHIIMFGYGSGHEKLKMLPRELFFHTDYRPLIRDSAHHVMDEQTQTMPHLMPPPFLVDIDGNPYPPTMQRLVPGRESCPTDQLVPNISVGNDNMEQQLPEGSYSNIDRMIEALANRQAGAGGADQAPDSNNERDNRARNGPLPVDGIPNGNQQLPSPGVRPSSRHQGLQRFVAGNWHREEGFKFHRRQYVGPMIYSDLVHLKQKVYSAGQQELDCYRREMRRRPLMINTSNNGSSLNSQLNRRGARATGSSRPVRRGQNQANGGDPNRPPPAYRTRAVRENEPEPEEAPEQHESSSSESSNSDDSTAIEEELDLSGSSSSDSQSSDYSDWVSHEPGRNLEPPKRSKRKHVQRRAYSPPELEQPGPSTGRRQKVRKIPLTHDGEIPEQFRPPEWLSEVIPRKAPYYPQMGDEVVYFRQGHQRYLEAVRNKTVYNLGNKCEPWSTLNIQAHELCKVIGIKYEIRPPRLCCLKLAIITESGELTGSSFAIKYHDMPDVLDFLVLKQTFDTSVRRSWGPGDRFRCMIEDVWWTGQIESHNQLSPEFPDSLFMCFKVRWDNGEYELMSPWDLEPVDDSRQPEDVGGAVAVLPEELKVTLYQPKAEEWPRGDRDASCRRIIGGLEQVMGLAIADLFLAPVDLNTYPEYAFVVEYPIDLNTIKSRFENHFYRRITSAQFDVRYLATNAEKFNESHSNIVRNARIVTDLCLRILSDLNDVDVPAVYHQLVDTYISSDSESENRPGPSTSASTSNTRRTTAGSRRSRRLVPEGDWRVDCRELLEMIWLCDDSEPFREPVDTIEHPDYLQIIDTPMDLRTIKEDLLGGNYESPLDFCKDMKLIFQNSRNFNTNKRSRIYSMTLRLSTLFEAHVKPIIYNWKSARKRGRAGSKRNSGAGTAADGSGGSGGGGGSGPGPGPGGSGPSKRRDDRRGPADGSSGTGSSTRRSNNSSMNTSGSSRTTHHSDNDDEDDDDDEQPRKRTRNGGLASRRGQSSACNGVSSSSNNVIDPHPGPSRSRGAATTAATSAMAGRVTTRARSQDDDEDEASASSDDTGSSSETSDSSDDDSTGVPVSHRADYDSGEMYDPYKKKKISKPKKDRRKSHAVSSSTAKKKRPSMGGTGGGAGGSSSNRSAVARLRQDLFGTGRRSGSHSRLRNSAVGSSTRDTEARGSSGTTASASVTATGASGETNDKPKNSGASSSKRPRRSTRNHTETSNESEDDDDADAGEGPSTGRTRAAVPSKRMRGRYESDHSYHKERPKTARIVSDTDNDDEPPRSTRGSARRAQAEWGKSEDSLEAPQDEDDEDYDARLQNSQTSSSGRRIRPRRPISDPEQSPEETSQISKRGSTQRAAANRNRANWLISESENENNQPGPSTSGRRRPGTDYHQSQSTAEPSSSYSRSRVVSRRMETSITTNGTAATSSTSSSTRMVRKTVTSSSSRNSRRRRTTYSETVTASSVNHSRTRTPPPHTVDHNYGEPGPGTMRRTRNRNVVLSRHQRNADELDQIAATNGGEADEDASDDASDDDLPLRASTAATTRTGMISSRLRSQTTPAKRKKQESSNDDDDEEDPRDGGRRGDSEDEYDGDQDQDAQDDDEHPLDEAVAEENAATGDSDDSDDNTPLHVMASSSRMSRSSRSRTAAAAALKKRECALGSRKSSQMMTAGTAVAVGNSRARRKERLSTDDEYEAPGPSSGRSTRNLKRPRYNEETDEDETTLLEHLRQRSRRPTLYGGGGGNNGSNLSPSNQTPQHQYPSRHQSNGSVNTTPSRRRHHSQRDDTDDDDDDTDDGGSENEHEHEEALTSVSSRGRVRRINPKARNIFRE